MKRYGLLGYPLTHSFSKRYFTEKFEKENISSTYENFEIDNINKFPDIIKNNPEIIGLNVTIPYKEQVIPYLDELNDAARDIAAVNTIRIKRTKSGIMLGLGEMENEVYETLNDLSINNVDIVTLGQYLQPSKKHLPVKEFISPDQFKKYELFAKGLGFRHVESGPLVRSSYKAKKHIS